MNAAPLPIDKRFFGIQMKTVAHWQPLGFGSLRLWDSNTTWRSIEKSKGKFDFSIVDRFVELASDHGMEVVWTLGQAPNWATGGQSSSSNGTNYNSLHPSNIQDWRDYLRVIGTRFKGKIRYYEVWNEPNLTSFYSGTTEQLVQLTREANKVLKAIDPNIKIISPSYTLRRGAADFDKFLAAGGNDWIDIVGCHLYSYPNPPEDMINVASAYQAVMVKNEVGHLPLWNTESTWNSYYYQGTLYGSNPSDYSNQMPDDLGIAYLVRMYLCNWVAGVQRCFFYGMDQPWSRIRLLDMSNLPTIDPPGYAYQRMVNWLTGASINDYATTSSGIHYVTLTYQDGKSGYIFWTDDDRAIPLSLPGEVMFEQTTAADGSNVDTSNSITVTKMPIYAKTTTSQVDVPPPEPNDAAIEVLYNSDFSLDITSEAVPLGWQAGSMTVAEYTGADVPAGRRSIMLSPTSQFQQIRQYLRKPLKKGATYRISINYKLPSDAPSGQWMISLETGVIGTTLVQNAQMILPVQNSFQTRHVDFFYDYASPAFPLDSRITVVNTAPTGQQRPLYVAGISLLQLNGPLLNDQHAYNIIYSPVKPSAGSFNKGDQILFTDADLNQSEGIGWVCTSAGTFGTLNGVNGTTTGGSSLLTVATPNALNVGDVIRIGSDISSYFVSAKRSSTQYELSNSANTTQTNQPIAKVPPVFTRLAAPPTGATYTNPATGIAVGPSPFVYENRNTYPVDIAVSGGTVASVEFSRNGTTWFNTGQRAGIVSLSPSDQVRVRYSSAPTIVVIPR